MMTVIDIDEISQRSDQLPPTVIALGNFDGVHNAHRKILEIAAGTAGDIHAVPAVFTFRKSGKPEIIPYGERKRLIEESGIKILFETDFERVKDVGCRVFFENYLLNKMHAVSIVCGYNYRFGIKASGDVKLLGELCGEFGVGLTVVDRILYEGADVSSSNIRTALRSGDVVFASELLGRPFSLTAKVRHGKNVGNKHGVPTLNLDFPSDSTCLAYGVYSAYCYLDGKRYNSVCNVGVDPTFGNGVSSPLCEINVFDFSGDVYGDEVKVEFLRFLRNEKKFCSSADLYEQIEKDISKAKSLFKVNFNEKQ